MKSTRLGAVIFCCYFHGYSLFSEEPSTQTHFPVWQRILLNLVCVSQSLTRGFYSSLLPFPFPRISVFLVFSLSQFGVFFPLQPLTCHDVLERIFSQSIDYGRIVVSWRLHVPWQVKYYDGILVWVLTPTWLQLALASATHFHSPGQGSALDSFDVPSMMKWSSAVFFLIHQWINS